MLRQCPLVACLAACTAASAIVPGDLPSVGPVQTGGDAAFLAMLPTLSALYSDTAHPDHAGPTFFDPASGLNLPTNWAMRVYFISHDADYPDAFGLTTVGGDLSTGMILFDDASTLALGDHVELSGGHPYIFGGSLFALTNHTATGGDVLWSSLWLNSDHLSHIQVAEAPGNTLASEWFALALDDQLGGGDRDWNDLRLAIHFYQVTTPEPSTWALVAGFATIAGWLWRRQHRAFA
jgi:hypothetical protein